MRFIVRLPGLFQCTIGGLLFIAKALTSTGRAGGFTFFQQKEEAETTSSENLCRAYLTFAAALAPAMRP